VPGISPGQTREDPPLLGHEASGRQSQAHGPEVETNAECQDVGKPSRIVGGRLKREYAEV